MRGYGLYEDIIIIGYDVCRQMLFDGCTMIEFVSYRYLYIMTEVSSSSKGLQDFCYAHDGDLFEIYNISVKFSTNGLVPDRYNILLVGRIPPEVFPPNLHHLCIYRRHTRYICESP